MKTPKIKIGVLLLLAALAACDGDDGDKSVATPADVQVFVDNAAAFRDKGQYQSAFIEARNAIQAAPDDERGHVALAETLLSIGQGLEASRVLEEIDGDSAAYSATLADAYVRAGKVRSAEDTIGGYQGDWGDHADKVDLLKGQIAFQREDLAEAESIFQSLLLRESELVDANLGLASIAATRSDLSGSLDHVEAVLAIEPANPRALLYKANIAAQNGELEQSEGFLMDAISSLPNTDVITPLRFAILTALRNNLTQQGKTSEALIYSGLLNEATPGAEEVQSKLQEAIDAISASDFETAKALLAEVEELAPNSAQAGTLQGLLAYLEGDNAAAVEQFDKYVDPETASPMALQVAAAAELRLNQPEKVIEKLEADIDDSRDGRLVAMYAIALVSAGRVEEGEQYFLKAFELDPDAARTRLPLARLYNLRGETEAATEQLAIAFKTQPSDPVVQGAYLGQLFSNQDFAAADDVVAGLRSSYPDSQESLLFAANYLVAREQYDEAEKVLSRVLSLGDNRAAHYQLARINLIRSDYDGAQKVFEDLVNMDPEDAQAYKGIITAYELRQEGEAGIAAVEKMQQESGAAAPMVVLSEYFGRNGDIDKAFEMLEAVPDDTAGAEDLRRSLYLARSSQALQEQDVDTARQSIVQALSEFPEDARLLAALVTVEIAADNLEEAGRVHARLRDAVPDAPVVKILAGDLANRARNYKQAYDHYLEAWEVNRSDQVAIKVYSMARQIFDLDDANHMTFLEEWRDALPNSLPARVTIAGHYMEAGDSQAARAEYEALLEINENVIVAQNNLAWIYGEDEIDKAVKAAEAAYRLAPERAEIIDTYGWFLFKSGEVEEARRQLARALELAPDNAEIREHYDAVK